MSSVSPIHSGTDVSSPPYVTLDRSYVNIQNRNGTSDLAASGELITSFPTLWSGNHRLRGITQSLVRYTSPGQTNPLFPRLYSQGAPAYTPIARWSLIYDPREPSHDFNDNTTWAWSENGVLVSTFVLSLFPQVTYDDIDWTLTADEATKADQNTITLTGTEVRSRAAGAFELERDRNEVLAAMLRSCGLELATTTEGKYYVRLIDELRLPEVHIEKDYIVSIDERAGRRS